MSCYSDTHCICCDCGCEHCKPYVAGEHMKPVVKKTARKLNNVYTWLWLSWIAFFVGVEAAAILDKRSGDTLSENVLWFQEHGIGIGRFMTVTRVAVAGLLVWLFYHFNIQKWG